MKTNGRVLTADELLAKSRLPMLSSPGLRLTTLARTIESLFPDLRAAVEESWSNTDQKIPGTRLSSPGKGRSGSKLVVTRRDGAQRRPVYAHDLSETYRNIREAVDTVAGWVRHPGDCRRGCELCRMDDGAGS